MHDGNDSVASTLVTQVVGKMLCDVHSTSKKNALDEFYGDAMKPCAAPGASIEMRPSRVGVAMYERAADGTNQIKQGLSKVLAAGSLFDASVSFMYWELSDEQDQSMESPLLSTASPSTARILATLRPTSKYGRFAAPHPALRRDEETTGYYLLLLHVQTFTLSLSSIIFKSKSTLVSVYII